MREFIEETCGFQNWIGYCNNLMSIYCNIIKMRLSIWSNCSFITLSFSFPTSWSNDNRCLTQLNQPTLMSMPSIFKYVFLSAVVSCCCSEYLLQPSSTTIHQFIISSGQTELTRGHLISSRSLAIIFIPSHHHHQHLCSTGGPSYTNSWLYLPSWNLMTVTMGPNCQRLIFFIIYRNTTNTFIHFLVCIHIVNITSLCFCVSFFSKTTNYTFKLPKQVGMFLAPHGREDLNEIQLHHKILIVASLKEHTILSEYLTELMSVYLCHFLTWWGG